MSPVVFGARRPKLSVRLSWSGPTSTIGDATVEGLGDVLQWQVSKEGPDGRKYPGDVNFFCC